jgi:hypothetical protein
MVFSFCLRPLDEDSHGVWLFAPVGSTWVTPDDRGTLPVDAVILMTPGECFTTWWVDDPRDRRIEIDICLPPERTRDGWMYTDLELDVFRHEPELIEVKDREEFEAACRNGWITATDAALAETTTVEMQRALERRVEPWGDEGWRRLSEAQRPGEH